MARAADDRTLVDAVEKSERPALWSYLTHCANGHQWGPGLVTVGWMPCECPEAQAKNIGHGSPSI